MSQIMSLGRCSLCTLAIRKVREWRIKEAEHKNGTSEKFLKPSVNRGNYFKIIHHDRLTKICHLKHLLF